MVRHVSCVASATAVDIYSLGGLTIDKISDDVLLCIFDAYRRESEGRDSTWPWHVLVHICRKWRNLVFGRPGHLNLRLVCKSKTDMKRALDIWPALPIVIDAGFDDDTDEDDIFGALDDRDRIVGISLWGLTQSEAKKCLRVMQQPFPVLTSLDLEVEYPMVAHVNTDPLLGGSIPRLKMLSLTGCHFSTLPTLLSSASELVDLRFGDFLVTGREHISPEAMATCLSSLTRLQSLSINFRWRTNYPTGPPPSTLTVLPALINLSLEGPHGYLEDLLTRIDTPVLEDGNVEFDDIPNFDSPQIPQFIHRTGMFNFPSGIDVDIHKVVSFELLSSIDPAKRFSISFPGSDARTDVLTEVGLIEQLCTRCPPLLSHIEQLQLGGDVEYCYKWPLSAPWMKIFQPFTAVQILHLSGPVIMPDVSRALGVLSEERTTGVLPVLHTLVLSWPWEVVAEAARLVEPFIVARKHSEHPVALKCRPWEEDWSEWDSSDAE